MVNLLETDSFFSIELQKRHLKEPVFQFYDYIVGNKMIK